MDLKITKNNNFINFRMKALNSFQSIIKMAAPSDER